MNSAPSHEIVIIRRGSHAHEEGHHGGVWKIAFADFMTAMMAFFLVLWIVNSSSKETRASIARYFNPVKLSDTTPARKGLQTAKELDFDAAAGEAGKADKRQDEGCGTSPKGEKAAHTDGHDAPKKTKSAECAQPAGSVAPRFPEESLLAEPQAILSDIVQAEPVEQAKRDKADADRTSTIAKAADAPRADHGKAGLAAEPAFSDPFEPVSPVMSARRAVDGRATLRAEPNEAVTTAALEQAETLDPGHPPEPSSIIEAVATVERPVAPSPAPQPSLARPIFPGAGTSSLLSADLAEALKDDMPRQNGPSIEIRAVPEGTLISLTDGLQFGMFAIGSAEPRPRTVILMARIAGVLKRHPGAVVVRGHTDGRQYPNARYDNWHLSADRAQMSFQMLLRGGLDPKRLERIEGHADRMPKNAGDPGAAENRRIEILLKAGP